MPSQSEENEVEVPWGKGILGWVAETGETVNLDVAYEVSRKYWLLLLLYFIMCHQHKKYQSGYFLEDILV